jgi:hypothetical protein
MMAESITPAAIVRPGQARGGRFLKWTIIRSPHRLVLMSKSLRFRHVIALAAAYVVALQALLLPLSVAAGSPFHSSLCAATDGSPQPTGHDGGCPCAAGCGTQCCVQSLAGPPQVAIILAPTRAIAITPMRAIEPIIRPADRSPQIPRAPPAV